MASEIEKVIKKILLENYKAFKSGLGLDELTRLAGESMNVEVSYTTVQGVLDALIEGAAIVGGSQSGYVPTYTTVED